ncbi:hypothetical protein ABHA52_10650 [Enterococcus faecium]|uniref:hypothetical protein n=1 Tax=Enterococcus faecium TaxID=1352 RepID=UPI0011070801|nr:hypothetical protein [Enterococcus faecium]MDB7484778.1 hypothetical protein [Enterococcus faecium]MDB7489828.1 hypothetical protein [Enterococcus faecium]MDB7492394.1 hypothetical protein [Enterococcus faecium]MDB7495034.1 hypothetical protein [Enterococcus faecium]MDB7497494.1 hypothetical protein [Enterococcus faecium]
MNHEYAKSFLSREETIEKVRDMICKEAIRNMGLYDYEHDLTLEIENNVLVYKINGIDWIKDNTLTDADEIDRAISETVNQVEEEYDSERDLLFKFSNNLSKNMAHKNQEDLAKQVMFIDLPSFLAKSKVNNNQKSKGIFGFLKKYI